MPRLSLLLFSVLICGLSSCVSHQELINFRTGKEKLPTLSQLPKQEITNQADLKLQVNDILALIIMSPDGILSTPYNLVPAQVATQTTSPLAPNTFLIGSDGMLHVPSIAAIKAAGLTVKELREEVLKKVSVFLENPSVNIRLINFKISVTGEVERPGTFQISNERITVLEALSLAGDLTSYSNREHVMIVREKDGVREYGEISLKDNKFFTSPYYYLQQNDLIYVEPSKGKTGTLVQPLNPYFQPISVALSTISTLIALIAIFKK
jgi:polysaccharide biosynthesis/export protein